MLRHRVSLQAPSVLERERVESIARRLRSIATPTPSTFEETAPKISKLVFVALQAELEPQACDEHVPHAVPTRPLQNSFVDKRHFAASVACSCDCHVSQGVP